MFRLQIERVVSASHAIVIGGQLEEVHEHDWRVRVRVEGPELDSEGLLCDFHALEQGLEEALAPFEHTTLNNVPPFDDINPTAEHFAQHIATRMRDRLPSNVLHLESSVTEAPGCEATVRLAVTAAEARAE